MRIPALQSRKKTGNRLSFRWNDSKYHLTLSDRQRLQVTIPRKNVPWVVRGESMQTFVVSEGSPASGDFRSVTVRVEGIRNGPRARSRPFSTRVSASCSLG